MKSEFITLDDPRVKMKSTRTGRIFSLDGKSTHPDYPFPHTSYDNGLHIEPRMTSVFAGGKSFNLNPGDFAEIEIENVSLLGIVLELADHHFDIDLIIDGKEVYGDFSCISSYMPSSDGFGHVHWIMLDRAKHKVELKVSNKYNRMLDAAKIKPSHACLTGFILKDNLNFPPPTNHSWVVSQDRFPKDIRGRNSNLKDEIVPVGGYLYLMDLYGHGSLESLAFSMDQPLILEILDGGARQEEFPIDFPSWIRRVDFSKQNSGALQTVFELSEHDDNSEISVVMKKPAIFGSRLIVRLLNPSKVDVKIKDLYMEGILKSI